jgi:hypothetical protein
MSKIPHHKECKFCKKMFKCDANSNKVTCSNECMLSHRENKKAKTNCLNCGKYFTFSKSTQRIFCSYDCFKKNGGPQRAGFADVEKIEMYGRKKDANHNEIVDALTNAGAYVIDMSHVGKGFPDLIVGFQNTTILMEIKNPKTSYGKRGLNKNQLEWKEKWLGGAYCVVDSIEAALRMIGVCNDT